MITKSKIFKQNRQTKTKFLRLGRYIKRDNFPIDAIKYHRGKSWNEAEEILKGMLKSKLRFNKLKEFSELQTHNSPKTECIFSGANRLKGTSMYIFIKIFKRDSRHKE